MPEPARTLRRGALVLTGLLLAAGSASAAPRIRVGPEVLVNGSVLFPQVETTIAANPRDPRNLVGGSMSLIERSIGTRTYVTFDGGSTWENVPLPKQARDGGDPQVAFTPRGTAIYLELPTVYGPLEIKVVGSGKTAKNLYEGVWKVAVLGPRQGTPPLARPFKAGLRRPTRFRAPEGRQNSAE